MVLNFSSRLYVKEHQNRFRFLRLLAAGGLLPLQVFLHIGLREVLQLFFRLLLAKLVLEELFQRFFG